MPFKTSIQKYSGRINKVEIGTGDTQCVIGGGNVLPFYAFDGSLSERPLVGLEIVDVYPDKWLDELKNLYGKALQDTVAWARFAEETYKPDFICLRLESADPNGLDKSPEDCAALVKAVADAIQTPLVVAGTQNHEKDQRLFEKVAEEAEGANLVLLSTVEENYKVVGTAGALAYKHKVAGESSVDINLAKQLNILLNQLGVPNESIVMNIGNAAVGYGFEYVTSTLDRIRLAGLGQDDKSLQLPIITPVSFDTWNVKETVATIEDAPEWGSQEERGIAMEVSTATGVLASGSNAVIVRHPRSAATLKTLLMAFYQ